jgi:hypothetical protein
MTGAEVKCGYGTTGEMRLDAGETPPLRARVPTDDPDRLLLAPNAIFRCQRRSVARFWRRHCPESGECRLTGSLCRVGRAGPVPLWEHAQVGTRREPLPA